MMTSTSETRRRALEKEEGDDDNDNKVVGFLVTNKQWLLRITKTFILVHKNLPSLAHQSTLQEDLLFSQKIEEKKTPSCVHASQYITP